MGILKNLDSIIKRKGETKTGTKQGVKEKDLLNAELVKAKAESLKEQTIKNIELLKVRVSKFDELIDDKGLERGSTVLISGGCGTGKTTFVLQSLYLGALNGEKGAYISFEEDPVKIKMHMKKNFGWDFDELEEKELITFIKIDPIQIARTVEGLIAVKKGQLDIKLEGIKFPFRPDRVGVDSLSALSITFEEEENYRRYIRFLFEELEQQNSINFVISETEQNPKIYSRAGVEEFLADGVVVLYNVSEENTRKKYLEILKLRSSNHERHLIEYAITPGGIDINYALKKKK